tara:strand:- start:865 stop:1056 length:192 start_codon:yes stop_codon:yes gene_type:complete
METTKWFASRTLWVNVVALVATLAGAFKLDLGLTPEVQATVVTTIMAVVNIVLRFVTTTPISK